MAEIFNTADELMEHLKQQIVAYDNGEQVVFEKKHLTSNFLSNDHLVNTDGFKGHVDMNNNLWNVSANRPITSHRKGIGKLIVSAKRFVRKLLKWYVGDTFELQAGFNGSVTNSFNELYNIINVYNVTLEGQKNQIEMLLNQATADKEVINTLNYKVTSLESKISSLESNGNELAGRYGQLEDNIHHLKVNMDYLLEEGKLNNVKISMFKDFTKELTSTFKEKIQIGASANPLPELVSNPATSKSPTQKLLQSEQLFDYLSFENKFRGSVEDIKNRQTAYLPYFAEQKDVLDIGCGRGEFVELLMENGIGVKGIDLNEDMVEYCRNKELPVFRIDAVNYLDSAEDESLGGIFLGQVIEHMPTDIIINIVNLAYKKLKKGAYLIMETPNPETLAIFNRFFYIDPTHVKPVHPLTARYYVEQAGFEEINIRYSGLVEEELRIPFISAATDSIENIEEINTSIERLNSLLYGYQDYAIIAKK